jgi:hypothetical protein
LKWDLIKHPPNNFKTEHTFPAIRRTHENIKPDTSAININLSCYIVTDDLSCCIELDSRFI